MADDRPWRLQRQKRGAGAYWTLIRGSGALRASISIGHASEEEARRYLSGIEVCRLVWREVDRQVRALGGPAQPYADGTGDAVVFAKPRTSADGTIVGSADPEYLLALLANATDKDAVRRQVLTLLWNVGRGPEAGELDAAELTRLLKQVDLPVNHGLMTLREYHDTVWEPHRSVSNPESWKRERGRWQRDLLPAFGRRRLVDLDRVSFDEFIQNLPKKAGGAMSGNSKRLVRAAYQACLTYAERKGHIAEKHKFYPIKGATELVYEIEPLTPAEVRQLLDATKYPMHRCLFAVGIVQGLRPSEAVRLCWEHIDLERRIVDMSHIGTKTKRARAAIPLFPLAHDELTAWRIASGSPTSGPVFAWNGKPLKSYRTAIRAAARRAGIEKRITQYLLRHTFATRSLEHGVSRDHVAAVMRHTNPRMVEQHYDRANVARVVDTDAFPDWIGDEQRVQVDQRDGVARRGST